MHPRSPAPALASRTGTGTRARAGARSGALPVFGPCTCRDQTALPCILLVHLQVRLDGDVCAVHAVAVIMAKKCLSNLMIDLCDAHADADFYTTGGPGREYHYCAMLHVQIVLVMQCVVYVNCLYYAVLYMQSVLIIVQ